MSSSAPAETTHPRVPHAPLRRLAAFVLAAALAAPFAASAADWAPNLTLAGIWHDNATNSENSADQLDSLQLNADILASQSYAFGLGDTLQLSGHAAGDWWPRYQELLGGAIGARAAWQHRFGADAFAAELSLEAAGDAVLAREHGRSGTQSAVTLALRKRLNNQWRAAVWHELGRLEARHAVYDRTSSETAVELGFDVSSVTRLTLTARYGSGDVVSYAETPSAALASIARVAQPVDTFDRPMIASSFDARTWSARAAYVRAIDPSSALVLAYEIRQTREQPVRITNQLLSVSLVHQF